jgi:hypothetical protein
MLPIVGERATATALLVERPHSPCWEAGVVEPLRQALTVNRTVWLKASSREAVGT